MNSIITSNQVETLLILFSRAKTALSNYSDNAMVESGTPKNANDSDIENELNTWVTRIQNLPTEQPGKVIQLTQSEIDNIKRWGRFEIKFYQETGNEIQIGSQTEFEHYTFELNKFKAEQQ